MDLHIIHPVHLVFPCVILFVQSRLRRKIRETLNNLILKVCVDLVHPFNHLCKPLVTISNATFVLVLAVAPGLADRRRPALCAHRRHLRRVGRVSARPTPHAIQKHDVHYDYVLTYVVCTHSGSASTSAFCSACLTRASLACRLPFAGTFSSLLGWRASTWLQDLVSRVCARAHPFHRRHRDRVVRRGIGMVRLDLVSAQSRAPSTVQCALYLTAFCVVCRPSRASEYTACFTVILRYDHTGRALLTFVVRVPHSFYATEAGRQHFSYATSHSP